MPREGTIPPQCYFRCTTTRRLSTAQSAAAGMIILQRNGSGRDVRAPLIMMPHSGVGARRQRPRNDIDARPRVLDPALGACHENAKTEDVGQDVGSRSSALGRQAFRLHGYGGGPSLRKTGYGRSALPGPPRDNIKRFLFGQSEFFAPSGLPRR